MEIELNWWFRQPHLIHKTTTETLGIETQKGSLVAAGTLMCAGRTHKFNVTFQTQPSPLLHFIGTDLSPLAQKVAIHKTFLSSVMSLNYWTPESYKKPWVCNQSWERAPWMPQPSFAYKLFSLGHVEWRQSCGLCPIAWNWMRMSGLNHNIPVSLE